MYKTTATMVDDLARDTRPIGEQFLGKLKQDVSDLKKKPRNSVTPYVRSFSFMQPLVSGVLFSNSFSYGSSGDAWKGFFALPAITQISFANPYQLILDVAVDWNPIGTPSGTPSAELSRDTYFVFGQSIPDSIYTGGANYFYPWFGDLVGQTTFKTDGSTRFTRTQKYYRLNDTISSRVIDNTNSLPVFTSSNRTKITQAQLETIYQNGAQLAFGVFVDSTGLSPADASFVANQNVAHSWVVTAVFNYFGTLATQGES